MFIKNIRLENFRNYNTLNLNFFSRLIFFIGENGSGKTNIIESISLLSYLKSFKDNPDVELINWSKDNYYIKVNFLESEINHSIEMGFDKGIISRKKIKLDGNLIKKKSELIGNFISVIFAPSDLIIIEGGPGERRKFLDSFISSVQKEYLEFLIEYNKILKNRNVLLKKKANYPQLKIWDEMLIASGVKIYNYRFDIINKLNEFFKKDILEISGGKDDFFIYYQPNITNETEFSEKLNRNISRDFKLGYTTAGVHRDNILIGKEIDRNGLKELFDITEFASQGQKRSVVISLKTAVFKIIKNNFNRVPVILVDDVIRELDVKRREYFINLISNSGQVFFTTTDLEGIQDYIGNLDEKKQIFLVSNGMVKEIES